MNRFRLVTGFLLAATLWLPEKTHAVKIFDGKPKVIIASKTSITGSQYLEHYIATYLGKKENQFSFQLIFGRWSGMGYLNGKFVPFGWFPNAEKMVREGKKQGDVIFLSQSGIGMTPLPRIDDTESLNLALQELETMCTALKNAGAAKVYWSTMQYGFRHSSPFPWNEPHVVQEFNKRNSEFEGIDMVTPVVHDHPYTACGDMIHSTEYTKMVWSAEYLKAFLRNDGLPIPGWIDDTLAVQRARIKSQRDQLRLVSPLKGQYKVGDEIVVKWEGVPTKFADELTMTLMTRNYRVTGNKKHEFTGSLRLAQSKVPTKNKTAKILITPNMFRGDRAGKAIPVVVTLVSRRSYVEGHKEKGVNSCFWTESQEDWFNPGNMIMIYPGPISASTPVYEPPRPVFQIDGITNNTPVGPVHLVAPLPNHPEPILPALDKARNAAGRMLPFPERQNGPRF